MNLKRVLGVGFWVLVKDNPAPNTQNLKSIHHSSFCIHHLSFLLPRPAARALDGAEPAAMQALALVLFHARLVATRDAPARGDLAPVSPEADSESGEVGRARGGPLCDFGNRDRDAG